MSAGLGAYAPPLVLLLLAGAAALLHALQRSRQRTRRLAERQGRLRAFALGLAPTAAPADLARAGLEGCLAALPAQGGGLTLSSGEPGAAPLAAAAGSGADAWPASPLLDRAMAERRAVVEASADGARVALPLAAGEHVLGGLGLTLPEGRPALDAAELGFAQALADQLARALFDAQRLEAEARARAQAEAEARRERAQREAREALAAAPDERTGLQQAAALLVPGLCDGVVVQLLDGGSGAPLLVQAGLALRPELQKLLARSDPHWPWSGVATGQARLLSAAELRALGCHDDDVALVERAGVRTALSAPLAAPDGEILGALTLLAGERRAFGERERAWAGRLATDLAATLTARARLADAERRRRQQAGLLAALVHQLRTPLGALRLWLDVLRGQSLGDDAARAVDMLERSARGLTQLTDELFDLSQALSGKLGLIKHPTDLAAVVGAAVEGAAPAARQKGVALTSRVDPGLGSSLADAARLRQVLDVLIGNAVKFTPPEGHIDVRLDAVNGEARIEVRDTGVGIGATLLPRLFEPFREGSPARPNGELGLRLALARHVVQQHGGTLEAESAGEGQGSLFRVLLPRVPSAPAAEPAAGDAAAAAPLHGLRLLLVDDHEDTLRGLCLALERSGAEVTAVSSARCGFEALSASPPHVLVSDLAMPEEDGYAFMRRIRRLEAQRGGRVPAVAVSAHGGAEARRRAKDSGYDEHVPKPVDIPHLVRVLARLGTPGNKT